MPKQQAKHLVIYPKILTFFFFFCFSFINMQMEVTSFLFLLFSSEFSPFAIPDISDSNYWAY